MKRDRIRLIAILGVSIAVIITGMLYVYGSVRNNAIGGAVLGSLITLTIVAFAVFTYRRGNADLKKGFPLKDERSSQIMMQASSKAYFVSIYLLLAIGFISDHVTFRDVSQAISLAILVMVLSFVAFWIYYNRR